MVRHLMAPPELADLAEEAQEQEGVVQSVPPLLGLHMAQVVAAAREHWVLQGPMGSRVL